MRLREWQANQSLTAYATELMNDARFQGLLRMMEEEHIKNYPPVVGAELSAHTHILNLGQIYGYDLCLNNLRAAASFVPEQKPLQSTFEPQTQ